MLSPSVVGRPCASEVQSEACRARSIPAAHFILLFVLVLPVIRRTFSLFHVEQLPVDGPIHYCILEFDESPVAVLLYQFHLCHLSFLFVEV